MIETPGHGIEPLLEGRRDAVGRAPAVGAAGEVGRREDGEELRRGERLARPLAEREPDDGGDEKQDRAGAERERKRPAARPREGACGGRDERRPSHADEVELLAGVSEVGEPLVEALREARLQELDDGARRVGRQRVPVGLAVEDRDEDVRDGLARRTLSSR